MNVLSEWVTTRRDSMLSRPRRKRAHNKTGFAPSALFQVELLEERLLLTAEPVGAVSEGAFTVDDIAVQSYLRIGHETNGGPSLASFAHFGGSVAAIGDVNQDGVMDMAVSAGGRLDNGAIGIPDVPGAVYLLFMNADGTVASTVVIDANTPNVPDVLAEDSFGCAVAGLGDLDGDGVVDIAIGACAEGRPTGPSPSFMRGAVHIVFLNADGSVKNTTKINGDTPGGPVINDADLFGRSIAAIGDLDGDGITEIAVGATGDTTGANDAFAASLGAVHILYLNRDGSVKTSAKIDNNTPGGPELENLNQFGFSTVGLGDIDGDGVGDIAVGMLGFPLSSDSHGGVTVFLLNADGSIKSSTLIDETTPNGPVLEETERYGYSLAGVGDVDGDGVGDLAVGIRGFPASGIEGALDIVLLNSDGTLKATKRIAPGVDGGPPAGFVGVFADSIANLGDLDGDGSITLAVGAEGAVGRGSTYLLKLATVDSIDPSVDPQPVPLQTVFNGLSYSPERKVTLRWAEAVDATAYELRVYHNGLGTEFVYQIFSDIEDREFTFAGPLATQVVYTAFVRATNGNGPGAWALLDFFQFPQTLPPRPVLTGPTGDVFDDSATITWGNHETTDNYTVLIYDVNQGTEVVREDVGDVGSYVATSLPQDTRYQVFVQARTADGVEVLSEPLYFNMLHPLLPAPVIIVPNLSSGQATPRILFTGVVGAADYEVFLYDKDAGQLHVPITTGGQGRFDVPADKPLVAGRTYQMFVRALSANGKGGEFGIAEFAYPTQLPSQDLGPLVPDLAVLDSVLDVL